MPQNYNSKVVLGNETLIDITDTTATAARVLSGDKFYGADGAPVTGACTFDADTSNANATAAEILSGKSAYVNAQKVNGSMANRGAQNSTITTKSQQVTIQQGYHDGSGSVGIDPVEIAKIVAGNIRNGVEILGQLGSYTGSELIKATTGTATPALASQTILPTDAGDFDYFTQFTVAAIPVTRTQNATGGYTVTIAPPAA